MGRQLKAWSSVGALTLALGGAGLWMGQATARQETTSTARTRPPRQVRTATVETRPVDTWWEGHGLVRAGDRAELAFTLGGRLSARPVDVGDQVRRGEVLARIDARAYQHAARAAEADLERAETQRAQSALDAERLARLGDANAVAKEQVQRTESALRASRANELAAHVQLDEAHRALSETLLRAPFDAVVAAVALEPGEMAAPGQTIVVLSGRGGREVEIEVPIGTATRIQPGTEARVRLPLSQPPQTLAATVKSVGTAVSRRAGLLPVVVFIDPAQASQATPGAAAHVRIPISRPARMHVSAAAVLDPTGSHPRVLRVVRGEVQSVPVQVGALLGTRVVIEGDLANGDQVVVSGGAVLRDGDRVRVLP